MRLVLDGFSALYFWMSAATTTNWVAVDLPNPQLTRFDGTAPGELSRSIALAEDKRIDTLDLLVGHAGERRRTATINCRTWGDRPLPQKSIYQIGSDLFVISPELCMVRLAVTVPRLELYRYIAELMGIYALSFTDRQDLIQREPLTNREKVRQVLEQCKGVPGARAVRDVLRWIPEGSASPRETSMDIELAMPTRLGGQGLPPFMANYKIDLSESAVLLTVKKYLVADVAWPDKGWFLEYNSSKHHDSEEQKEFDFEKITTLGRMKKTVVPISTRQYNDYDAFSSIVDGVREGLHVRDRYAYKAEGRRRETHEALLRIERRQREQPPLIDLASWQLLLPRLDLEGNKLAA